jgi:hypothetical protein
MRNFLKNKADGVPKQSVKREWKHLKLYELPKRNSTGEELVGLNYRGAIYVGVHFAAKFIILYTRYWTKNCLFQLRLFFIIYFRATVLNFWNAFAI